MPRLPSAVQADMVRRINLTLEGPVAEVMAQLVPELKKLPRRGVLEHVLDDPELLDRCFKAFRANPERFAALLVDQHNVPVETADALLSCGRSLDDVVAMVVRTHAKRHFRKRLDGENRSLRGASRQDKEAERGSGMLGRLVKLFVAGPGAAKAKRGRGEALYDAFKEHLLHDWQVPLVPEYSTLSPQMVKRLGSRILDYKVPEDIRRLRDNPKELPVPSTLPEAIPTFLLSAKAKAEAAKTKEKAKSLGVSPSGGAEAGDGARMAPIETAKPAAATQDRRARLAEVLTPDQKRLRGAAFTMTLLDPAVRAALPNAEQTVRITGLLSEMGGLPAKMLVGDLGLRTDQLAVTTIILFDMLGEDMFRRSFGVPGNLDYVGKFVERAKAAGISQDTELSDLAAFIGKMFAGVKKAQPPKTGAIVT
ncbi:hypothetical protein A6A04_14450 [Paramagnetospirillum marisnigri]|uniref:Uncharacterized protein n=1 Tax=Paramagnetospirillum marisnigri TaxID=1285242 RepID=A0A178MTW8_9PROT|nr:hypothetical protein [Paramagnetospirillum marisnigri]OAN53153.1 hypothetical protein A6A04_14450 [Paramagnetospirillum marisnigri]